MIKITKKRGTKNLYSVLFIKLSLLDKTLQTIYTEIYGTKHMKKQFLDSGRNSEIEVAA